MKDKKFKYKLKADYGRNGPKYYVTNVMQVQNPHSKIHVWGEYMARVNGPNTVAARFFRQVRWPTNPEKWFGFQLTTHFAGKNAHHQARRWLQMMADNPPTYCSSIRGKANAPDQEKKKKD